MKQKYSSSLWKISLLLSLYAILVSCSSTTAQPIVATVQPIVATVQPIVVTVQPIGSYITPIAPEAISGNSLSAIPVSESWLTYTNFVVGFSIEYPPGWEYVEQPDQLVVNFFPPGVNPQFPSSLIAFIFLPDKPYDGQPMINTGSDIHPIIAVGSGGGIQYEDSKYAIPTVSSYIELSYRGGTFLIKATKGPTENLVPQLEEILKTLNLSAVGLNDEIPTKIPVSEQWIAFDSNCSGNWEVYKLKLDGTNPIRLTDNSVDDGDSVISPDGAYIAFFSELDSDREIYTMRVDGTDVKRLTYSPGWDGLPTWSPDSKKLAFTSWRGAEMGIYVMNTDGANVWKLTSSPGGDWMPSWSPDGRQIAFASYIGNNISEIFVINSDGSDRTQLTLLNGKSFRPRWSPDGKQITFYYEGEGDNKIYVMSRDGSGIKLLIQAPGAGPITWSSDSSEIIFGIPSEGIYIMNTDGSNIRLIRGMRIVC